MSGTSLPELDFWEFVNCAQCHLPFQTDTGSPSIPFWLTECGHVICNNHLNADRSCTQCGEAGIQLIPLQKELEAPMSDWFRSVPQALDSVAYATRFQMETLASLVRHYKSKCVQQRSLIDRLKTEFRTLKKTVEDLKLENAKLQQFAGCDLGNPSDFLNDNGKRRMSYSHQYPNGARTNSSPRSVVTPVGPDRLTLPPDRQQPNFAPHTREHVVSQQRDRPGSSRFAEQYAYNPPHASASGTFYGSLSHEQTAPTRQALARQTTAQCSTGDAHIPPQSRPLIDHNVVQGFGEPGPSSARHLRNRAELQETNSNRTQMLPPPAPQAQGTSLQQRGSFRPPATPRLQASTGSRRFIPPTPNSSAGKLLSGRALLQHPQQAQIQRFSSFAVPGPSGRISDQSQGLSSGQPQTASFTSSGGERTHFIPHS